MMQFQLSFSPLLKRTVFFTDERVLLTARPLWLSSTETSIYLISTEIRVDKYFQPDNFSNQKLLKNRLSKIALLSSVVKQVIMGKCRFGNEGR